MPLRNITLVILRICLILLTVAVIVPSPARAADGDALVWPPATQQNKQWTRWWWMGNAVDKTNITRLLQTYHDAGIGGIEICPIYGVIGQENRYIKYLSPQWMDMLAWTMSEGRRIDIGVDMTTGTGWPMGGPDVSTDDASSNHIEQRFDVAGGSSLKHDFSGDRLQCIRAFSADGKSIDLTSQIQNGSLNWIAPDGAWRVYSIAQHGPIMKVKRAAPGSEGSILDPFSVKSIGDFLAPFDKAFADYKGGIPRSQFHDSYEYQGDWTTDLFTQFQALRGYDLRDQLPALNGDGDPSTVARVVCDYRQTMADLHTAYVKRWEDWCHEHGMLAREQAHGAPANTLDLYATADIPETETFGVAPGVGFNANFPMNKFASSAAHVSGKTYASSESFTWLGEHFQTSFADVKPVADYILLSGINHMLFHGMAYSPADAPWPGWLFYASVDFSPTGGLWHDMPAYTAYVARCQSILQSGKPSNDVLVYFPIYDLWQTPAQPTPLIGLVIGGQWMKNTPFYNTALSLQSHGFGVDYISDAQLAATKFENGAVVTGGNTYKAVVIPTCKFMPPETLAALVKLAKAGATIVVQDAMPLDVPGLANLAARQEQLKQSIAEIPSSGPGHIAIGPDVNALLDADNVTREPMRDLGLQFIRRTRDGGYHYFIVNRGGKPVDAWVTLSTPAQSAVILDPLFADRSGLAALRHDASGATQIYLQLKPGESRFLRTFTNDPITAASWHYTQPAGVPITLAGSWKVHFLEGGPALPADFQTDQLDSWTTLGDAEAKRFEGTARYTLDFDAPANANAADWLLDVGTIGDSARVRLNGADAGTLLAAPFELHVGPLLHPGRNTLELDVTNIAANRIADLDRRGVKWKIFRDVNIVSPGPYAPFDASAWPARDSGLLGPVRLIPLKDTSTN